MKLTNFRKLLPNNTDKKHTQVLLLDAEKGNIVETDNSLFDMQKWLGLPMSEWSAFLTSSWEEIKQKLLKDPLHPCQFVAIESVTNFSKGFYDCSFLAVQENSLVLWFITDRTQYYQSLIPSQQLHHDIAIAGQIKIGTNR